MTSSVQFFHMIIKNFFQLQTTVFYKWEVLLLLKRTNTGKGLKLFIMTYNPTEK